MSNKDILKILYTYEMLEGPQQIPAPEKASSFDYEAELNEFLDQEHIDLIGSEKIEEIKNNTKEEKFEANIGKEVIYNKYKKSLSIDGVETTAGEIIASRHFGNQINLPEKLDESFAGKQLRKKYFTLSERDAFTKKLNKELGDLLSEKNKRLDLFKSKAYTEIEKREDMESKQEGAIAEKMMIGVIEMISVDRPDLQIEVRGANAFQDVEEKIDFIITTKKKRRSIGIEEKENKEFDEKSFGIQFTINTSKGDFKKEQIQKAKDRGLDVDDLLYVEVDKQMIHNALMTWEKKGKPISGPWAELPQNTKNKALENLFKDILTEEQIKGLTK